MSGICVTTVTLCNTTGEIPCGQKNQDRNHDRIVTKKHDTSNSVKRNPQHEKFIFHSVH